MIKKRGILVLILLVLFLLAEGISVFALDVNKERYLSAYVCTDNSEVGDCDNIDGGGITWYKIGETFKKCDDTRCQESSLPPENGCWVNGVDEAFGNECSWAIISRGAIINAGGEVGNWLDLGYQNYDDDGADSYCILDSHNFQNGKGAMLCTDDNFWQECNKDALESIAWVNNFLYKCTEKENGIITWTKQDGGVDVDHDTYSTPNDCKDNPSTDLSFCSEIKTREDCGSVESRQCAICINPSAPEICGDGKDNDCNQQTSDDCNKNQPACEQTASPAPQAEAQAAPIPEGQTPPPLFNNIYGQKFSWIDTADGGKCCGYGGINDIGTPADGSGGFAGNYVCLKNAPAIVGATNIKVDWPETKGDGSPDRCAGDWCWVRADGAAKFHIFTIKQPDKTYDVVSNSQQWIDCKEGSPATLPQPLSAGDEGVSYLEIANRFSCYQEGDHYAWTECYGENEDAKNENTIKGRVAGEGLYSLYLVDRTENPEGELFGDRIEINTQKGGYQQFYGDQGFDFEGYDQLEFMVKFVGDKNGANLARLPNLPADVQLTIYGPLVRNDPGQEEPIKYFEGKVLGDILNSPSFDGSHWMLVQVPIPSNLKDVQQIVIESVPSTNFIGVKNVKVSKSNEITSPVCSGKDDRAASSWLTNIDQGDTTLSKITGEDLCKALYGDHAWLGNDNELDSTKPSANCCGNDKHEYYAGPSREKYGCWNSQPIEQGQTTMNVVFEVKYSQEEVIINYPLVDFEWGLTITPQEQIASYYVICRDEGYDLVDKCDRKKNPFVNGDEYSWVLFDDPIWINKFDLRFEDYQEGILTFYQNNRIVKEQSYTTDSHITFEPILVDTIKFKQNGGGPNFRFISVGLSTENNANRIIRPNQVSALESPKILENVVVDAVRLPTHFVYTYSLVYQHPDIQLFFQSNQQEITSAEIQRGKVTLFAATNKVEASFSEPQPIEIPLPKTFSCNQSSCLFPLPGLPPYTITNPHPELYELYFVAGSESKDQTLITNDPAQKFEVPGNLLATKVSQQVIYVNTEENGIIDQKFYGCNSADFVNNGVPSNYFESLGYCQSKSNQFCSPSVTHTPADQPKERFTTINSWSDEPLTQVGYEDISTQLPEKIEDLPSQLQLRDISIDEKDLPRNHTTTILPARNMISNAEFKISGQELPHWEIIKDNLLKEDERPVQDNTITLVAGEELRSERIAIPSAKELYFESAGTCTPEITLVDNNGNKVETTFTLLGTGKVFPTHTATFLTLHFTGPCTLTKPFLQLMDPNFNGPTPYYQIPNLPEDDARSGIACCPDNYCWNGYACAAPMTTSKLAEHISDGRDYRCINGEWSALPVKLDWNGFQWGFCSTEDQCLVDPTQTENTPLEQFYILGKIPQCLSDKTYLLDHYCQNGNWTSRTKFVASTLAQVAADQDFVLYCSSPLTTLPSIEDKESFVLGQESGAAAPPNSVLPTPAAPARKCFSSLSSTLVNPNENTCINNVCVLQFNDGSTLKTAAFATTLNNDLAGTKGATTADSFLIALGIPAEQVSTICPAGEGFVQCTNSLWYSKELNAVIYAKEGINLNPTIIDKITGWFRRLLGIPTEPSAAQLFLNKPQNFHDVYLATQTVTLDGIEVTKSVRAVKEAFPSILVAEYENFNTSVCSYVEKRELPALEEPGPLAREAGRAPLTCTQNEGIQRVEITKGVDFFWPQLTGKLRVG